MKTIRQIADEIGVSKQAVFKKIKREPLSTSLQGFTATVDGRLMVSVDGEKLIKQAFSGGEVSTTDNQLPPTESDEKTVEVDGQNVLYEILKMELQAKNEQIAALQAELSKERQHSREQAEKIAVLADQAQKLQLAQMSPQLMDGGGGAADLAEPEPIPSSRQTQQPEQPKSLKKVYHELFDEALAAYNAKKKKTRDKIPDYYEHIRQSKQEKLFHEAIFQIGNLTDCGCGSPGGERAAAALKEFAESFQERNPHLRVFNMVLHMDEATPHLHVDFVPVATEQSRGLSTRVSMKQALKQQGFEGLGRKQTEWKAWMEREKEALTEIAQVHEFEIISLGGGRPHMELPEDRAAAQRLEAVQEQVTAAEQEIATLEKQRKALQGNVKLLKAVEKVKPDLDAIQPEKTLTGAVKGVTVEQIKELKEAVIRGAAAEQKVRELKAKNQQLQKSIPSIEKTMEEARKNQRLENENRQLKVQVEYLEEDLSQARGISEQLLEGIGAVLDFLDRHLPEQFRPLVEKARELLPVPEVQQPEQEQERGHTWGGMEL